MCDYRQQQELEEEALARLQELQTMRESGIPESELNTLARQIGLSDATLPSVLMKK